MGRRIAELRGEMSQEELAEFSGLTRAYIGRVELGIVNPSFRTLMKIAAGLGLAGISYFFVPKAAREIEESLSRHNFKQ